MDRRVSVVSNLVLVLALTVVGTASASPAASGDRGGDRVDVIVVLDDVPDARAAAQDVARDHGAQLGLVYEHALEGFSASVPTGRLNGLRQDRRVDLVELDQSVEAFGEVPTGVDRIEADRELGLTDASGVTFGGKVDIAIIDTGIDHSHPDLNVVAGTDCARGGPFNNSCKDGLAGDGNGHGTHVAGSAAAIDHLSGLGVAGVVPGADLWAVRVLDNNGSGYISWIVAGIDWVTARADTIEVANMSLGCECSSSALDTALTNSTNAGVVYVVAAGNSAKDASTFSPANHDQVIAVSAIADFDGLAGAAGSATCRTDGDDTLASFSNFGAVVDLAAPGVCITSTWPGGGYHTISGTSMSSPHAAGAAALYVHANGVAKSSSRWSTVRSGLQSTTWSVAPTDTCGYDPEGKQAGRLLMLEACDGGGMVGTAPTADAAAAETLEDTAVTVTLGGGDAETCDLGFSIVTGPSDGSLSSITDATCSSGTAPKTDSASVDYTPATDFAGSDSFTYRVTDGDGNSADATVAITVNGVNDAPVAVDDSAGTATDTPVTIAVLANDTDVDSDPLTVLAGATAPTSGAIVVNADQTITYSPDAGFTGTDSFTYKAFDGTVDSNEARVTVTVTDAAVVTASVEDYSAFGGKSSDNHLDITIRITDANDSTLGVPATVSIQLYRNDGAVGGTLVGSTDGAGWVTFGYRGVGPGCYATDVTAVSPSGSYSWDGSEVVAVFENNVTSCEAVLSR
ncbi:MAG: S8 family serine peptidase [Actinobacteria bacterium]|nr:S8 family serine peptidase [Actinomycetota bacterium]